MLVSLGENRTYWPCGSSHEYFEFLTNRLNSCFCVSSSLENLRLGRWPGWVWEISAVRVLVSGWQCIRLDTVKWLPWLSGIVRSCLRPGYKASRCYPIHLTISSWCLIINQGHSSLPSELFTVDCHPDSHMVSLLFLFCNSNFLHAMWKELWEPSGAESTVLC